MGAIASKNAKLSLPVESIIFSAKSFEVSGPVAIIDLTDLLGKCLYS